MHGNVPAAGNAAISATARNFRNLPDTAADDAAKKTCSDWFPTACRAILGEDAGLQLHYITGYLERTCYNYAAGHTEPRGDFLRKLFHSPHGAPFFAAFMHECKAPWWRAHQRNMRLAAASEWFMAEIAKPD